MNIGDYVQLKIVFVSKKITLMIFSLFGEKIF